jgi:membrane protein YdbS with pleckstrin-like domain
VGELLRGWVLRLFRVPPEPRVPSGEAERVRIFRAAPNFYRYNLLRWGLAQAGALLGLLIWLVLLRMAPARFAGHMILEIVTWVEIAAWIAFLVQLPFTYALLRLDYELRWYLVSERSLRIREGLASIREQTMTFANIQNMAIRQGPLQRLLGIADLEVHTAGGGAASKEGKGQESGGSHMHVGMFRGVDNAEEIRDLVRDRVRRHRDAGLGDPDDAHATDAHTTDAEAAEEMPVGAAPATEPPLLEAARELLTETRRLREALTLTANG